MAVVKLKPEIKTLWLEALRSGKYLQGKHSLQRNGDFCCLGVLCEVYQQQGHPVQISTGNNGSVTYDGIDAVLPDRIQNWAFGSDVMLDPFVTFRNPVGSRFDDEFKGCCTLVMLNDCVGYDFNQIADIIEKHL